MAQAVIGGYSDHRTRMRSDAHREAARTLLEGLGVRPLVALNVAMRIPVHLCRRLAEDLKLTLCFHCGRSPCAEPPGPPPKG